MIPRRAFSLIELIVAIAILALLLGLLLPAIQSVRASAARAACQSNMRQVGLATHTYHDAHQHFPEGHIPRGPNESFPLSGWLMRLLPFIEQTGLWERTREAYATHRADPFQPPHDGGTTVVTGYTCPADARSHAVQTTYSTRRVALTNYLAVAGRSLQTRDGIYYSRSRSRVSDVVDGTSSTLAFGERPVSPDFWYGWWYAGTGQKGTGSLDAVLGVREVRIIDHVPVRTCPDGPYEFRPTNQTDPCGVFHFWSLHNGGANFAFADGSVRFLQYSANDAMPALATRAGGETTTLSD